MLSRRLFDHHLRENKAFMKELPSSAVEYAVTRPELVCAMVLFGDVGRAGIAPREK